MPRHALVALSLAALTAFQGCTILGALGGHVSDEEQRRAGARCQRDRVPAAYCPVPRDHTVAGLVLGLAIDYGLLLAIVLNGPTGDENP